MIFQKKYLFYILAFGSAIISSMNAGIDAAVSMLFVTDIWALGLGIFILGIPIGILFALIFSVKIKGKNIGKRVADPSFNGLRLLRKSELSYQVLAGIGNAMYTLGYFALFTMVEDPSIVLPFTQAVILYLVAIESINEKDTPTLSELQSVLIVTFGAILGSISLSGSLNVESLLIVFFIINPGWVLLTVYQRKLKWLRINGDHNDSINIRVWNTIFACLISAIIIISIDVLFGTNHIMNTLEAISLHLPWVSLIAVGAFFAFIFYIRALGIGKASVVQAIRSSVIIFSIPVSLVLISLNVIEPFSFEPTLLIIKGIGIIIMILGILSFSLNLVKAYIFIKIKPGYRADDIMKSLWAIRGVTHVSATAGTYDFIVKIRTRALVKGYENIIKRIQDIDAIKFFRWESILKEWEEI